MKIDFTKCLLCGGGGQIISGVCDDCDREPDRGFEKLLKVLEEIKETGDEALMSEFFEALRRK